MNNPKTQSEKSALCPVCGLELPARLKKCPQDGVVLKAIYPPDPLVGTVIAGRYEILSVIGRGGMSVVYKAKNKAVGSIVAVKTLKQDLITDEELYARFCQEAKAVQMLVHPHIISMHEFGVMLNGQPFIVMDYLAGQTLSDIIEESGRIPVKRTVKIFIQVCDALANAHSNKIIHRDIKPGNIMLVQTANEDDFVKIFDFGFAKLLPQNGVYAQQLTQTGDVLGTPLYMSPEQSRGKPLDSRSDVYSVGCVMYEAITGKAPLVGENVLDTMQKQINERPESLDTARPDLYIPEQLTTILFRTLEKDPAQRYQSMLDLKRDLELMYCGLSGKAPVSSLPMPGLQKLKQIPSDRTMSFRQIATAILIGALILGAGIWVVSALSAHAPQAAVESARQTSTLPTFTGNPCVVWSKYRQAGLQALEKRDYLEAEELFNMSLKLSEKTEAPEADAAVSWLELARTHLAQEKLSDAEKCCNKSLEIRRQIHDTNSREVADIDSVLGQINLARDNFKGADTYFQKALAVQQRELGPTHEDVATTLNNLGLAAEGEQNLPRAESYFKQALAIRTSALGPNKLPVAESLTNYARVLRKTKRTAEADKAEARAKSIRNGLSENK